MSALKTASPHRSNHLHNVFMRASEIEIREWFFPQLKLLIKGNNNWRVISPVKMELHFPYRYLTIDN